MPDVIDLNRASRTPKSLPRRLVPNRPRVALDPIERQIVVALILAIMRNPGAGLNVVQLSTETGHTTYEIKARLRGLHLKLAAQGFRYPLKTWRGEGPFTKPTYRFDIDA